MTTASLKEEQVGRVTVAQIGPEFEALDEEILAQVRDFLLDLADRADPPHLVIDLSHTDFFGSGFIEVLFRVWNRMQRRGGRFVLSNLKPYCAEVLKIARLDTVWSIYPTRAEAVAAFGGTEK